MRAALGPRPRRQPQRIRMPMSVPAYVPSPLQGQCLCGQVKFEVRTRHLRLYQCHCSLCRRQSGSSSNTAALVPLGQFRWLAGEKKVRSWVKDSGFRSDFCRTCGSPVPNQVRDLPMMWVPAGLLDEGEGLSVAAHLCLSSSAPWDQPPLQGQRHPEVPPLEELLKLVLPS